MTANGRIEEKDESRKFQMPRGHDGRGGQGGAQGRGQGSLVRGRGGDRFNWNQGRGGRRDYGHEGYESTPHRKYGEKRDRSTTGETPEREQPLQPQPQHSSPINNSPGGAQRGIATEGTGPEN